MALTSRVTLTGPDSDPEDIFSSSIGVIFPDDCINQHGDADHNLLYTSPFLSKHLTIALNKPEGDSNRRLFSHYLWNASLLLAEFVEADSIERGKDIENGQTGKTVRRQWDVRGLRTLEVGAGTGLPSIMSALLGARTVCVTDYPAPELLKTLKENILNNTKSEYSPAGSTPTPPSAITITGHEWGVFPQGTETLVVPKDAGYDRIFVADCLWMPWQHANLQATIARYLAQNADARAWVVAGFHTGRDKMRGFFDERELKKQGLMMERIWERDVDGVEREWVADRGIEDVTERKRWLVVGTVKRV